VGVLREGRFVRLWLAQVVSQFGDSITNLAVIVLVALVSKNGFMMGLVLFAQLLPSAVLGAFMGPFADRQSPQWLMVGADLYRMVIVLLMIPAQHHPLVLVTLVALLGVGTALFTPARSSVIPQLVGEERIPDAIALSQGTWSAMLIAGPAVAGLLLAIHDVTAIFVIDALTFVVSALLISSLQSVRAMSTEPKEVTYLQSLRSGVRKVMGMPALRFLLLIFIPVTLAAGMFSTDMNVVLLQVFKVSRLHFGMLESVSAVGTILGALSAPLFLRRLRPSVLLLSATGLIGIVMILVLGVNVWRLSFGLTPVYIWAIAGGYLNALLNVPLSSLFLGITPAEFRGRGGALLQAVVDFGVIVGVLLGGWLSAWNALIATTLAGATFLATAVASPWFQGYRALHAITPRKNTNATALETGAEVDTSGT